MNDVTAGCFGESYREARTSCWSFPFMAPPYECWTRRHRRLELERTSTIFSVGQGRTKRSFTMPILAPFFRRWSTANRAVRQCAPWGRRRSLRRRSCTLETASSLRPNCLCSRRRPSRSLSGVQERLRPLQVDRRAWSGKIWGPWLSDLGIQGVRAVVRPKVFIDRRLVRRLTLRDVGRRNTRPARPLGA